MVKMINPTIYLWEAFDFNEIYLNYLVNLLLGNAELYAVQVGYFKDKTQVYLIITIVNMRFKMYSFCLCDASLFVLRLNNPINLRQNSVAKNVAGF